jgi:predicted membrane protein (TIGR00267 family)
MKGFRWLLDPRHRFASVVGLTDGILTALTLASGKLLASNGRITLGLSVRIAIAASSSGMFIFFTAEYARLRGELVHASKQLNLASHGHLATTQLGNAVRREAVNSALVSSIFNFLGAFIPLSIAVAFPLFPRLPVVIAVAALGALGAALAHTIHGRMAFWALALMTAGAFLALVGVKIHVV